MITTIQRRPSGMILMELVIAIAIFGMVALGLMRALSIGAETAVVGQMELRMLLRLQSTLTEYSKLQRMEEGVFDSDPDDLGVITHTEIVKLDKMENEDGQVLQDMFHIIVRAEYDNFGTKGEMIADTYRYARLYQPQTGAPAAPGGQ
jgi:Prokaryotic N-terminal methylation motif